MGLQTNDASRAIQVIRVPQLVFLVRDGWTQGPRDVLDATTQRTTRLYFQVR